MNISRKELIQELDEEKLLRENKLAKPKRTIRHLFEELQLSGYDGSYSAVGRYAAKWKERSSAVSAVACVPLSYQLQ